MEAPKYPWEGVKSVQYQIRMTPAEKEELERLCAAMGGIKPGRYLLNLHHRVMGRLEGGRECANTDS